MYEKLLREIKMTKYKTTKMAQKVIKLTIYNNKNG